MSSQQLTFTDNPNQALSEILATRHGQAIIVADTNTARECLPVLACAGHIPAITLAAGEEHKTAESLINLYQHLVDWRATRQTLLIALGGGVVTDLAGFAAATFKRGMPLLNLPTTLLAQVDASVGGKTGFNFAGLKNEIGLFAPAHHVVISTRFLSTLPHSELLAGLAEMLKHALLDTPEALHRMLNAEPCGFASRPDALEMIRHSVTVKQRFVDLDPNDQADRHALNLGHTIGHAIESLLLERNQPVAHGIAVAWGLVGELVLSRMSAGLKGETLYAVARYVRDHYPTCPITCDHYPRLLQLMTHDKKNPSAGEISFTLLSDIGHYHIGRIISAEDITAALDIFRDLTQ